MGLKTFRNFNVLEEKKKDLPIFGLENARRMKHHIGKDVMVLGSVQEVCKLLSVEIFIIDGFKKYCGIIERKRGKKVFTSRKLITQIKPI